MSAFSKILKHTSTVTAIAMFMTIGSVAQAFNGMQRNLTISASSNALQLASMECQGNWVGAGCVDGSAGSSGGQGSTNPEGGKAPDTGCESGRMILSQPVVTLATHCDEA